jgi:hypothetical protein
MPTHEFKIRAGLCCHDSKIELDGVELTGVTRVSFELKANGLTTLNLDIMGQILVEGEFRESAILSIAQANPDKV